MSNPSRRFLHRTTLVLANDVDEDCTKAAALTDLTGNVVRTKPDR